jgi:hypothetical protein
MTKTETALNIGDVVNWDGIECVVSFPTERATKIYEMRCVGRIDLPMLPIDEAERLGLVAHD